jgi:hypothetical protein
MGKRNRSWIVRARCTVTKDIYCEGCTEEEARLHPYEYSYDEKEVDQYDYDVISVEEND